MSFTFADILQVSNVLIIPCVWYIIQVEKRLVKIETQIELLLEQTTP
ncbi:hypothetical protein ACO0LL_05625 [Undibacterium sp. TC4M20W]